MAGKIRLRTKIDGEYVLPEELENRELVLGNTSSNLYCKDYDGVVHRYAPIDDSATSIYTTWSADKLNTMFTTYDTILSLTDTPGVMGSVGQMLVVASDTINLEFVNAPIERVSILEYTSDWEFDTYVGHANQFVRVNDAGTQLTFAVATFLDMFDTPNSYGTIGYIPVINAGQDGLEWVSPSVIVGSVNFVDLGDTPVDYSGASNKYVTVNGAGDALEFINLPALGSTTFVGLTDTPGTFTADFIVSVNGTGDGLIYIDPAVLGAQSAYWGDDGNTPGTSTVINGVIASIGIGDTIIVSSDYSTISGGLQNTINASSDYSNVGGGRSNDITGLYGTVAGGRNNVIVGDASVITGGSYGDIEGNYNGILSGNYNSIEDSYSSISGGEYNSINITLPGDYSNHSFIGGGKSNSITDSIYAIILGGEEHVIDPAANYSTVLGGSYGLTYNYGQMVYATGSFDSSKGTAQTSNVIFRNTTTNSTPTVTYLDGSSELFTLGADKSYFVESHIIATVITGASIGDSKSIVLKGAINTDGDSLGTLVGTPAIEIIAEDSSLTTATADINVSTTDLSIQVIGISESVRWVAATKLVEVYNQ